MADVVKLAGIEIKKAEMYSRFRTYQVSKQHTQKNRIFIALIVRFIPTFLVDILKIIKIC